METKNQLILIQKNGNGIRILLQFLTWEMETINRFRNTNYVVVPLLSYFHFFHPRDQHSKTK